jgi:hypothetical protein
MTKRVRINTGYRKPDGWATRIDRDTELAVLDGPWLPGSWWLRPDLERQQQACRTVSNSYGSPASPVCAYRPTERWMPHPAEVHAGGQAPIQARVWTVQP